MRQLAWASRFSMNEAGPCGVSRDTPLRRAGQDASGWAQGKAYKCNSLHAASIENSSALRALMYHAVLTAFGHVAPFDLYYFELTVEHGEHAPEVSNTSLGPKR